LAYQLQATKAKLVVAHPLCLTTAIAAAKTVGLSATSIISLSPTSKEYAAVDELVSFGAGQRENYKAIRLQPGEARSVIAFLAMSSGTTGGYLHSTSLSARLTVDSPLQGNLK